MIVIKGVMPKSCGSCPMRSERWCNSLHKDVLYTFTSERLPDCPIVGEIPDEHGRVIDADQLQDVLNLTLSLVITDQLADKEIELVHRTIGAIADAINDMDTVLEATK